MAGKQLLNSSSLPLVEVLPSCCDIDFYYCNLLRKQAKQNPASLSLQCPTAPPPALSSNFSSPTGFLHLEMSISCWWLPPFVLNSSFIFQKCAAFFTWTLWVRKTLVLLWCFGTEQQQWQLSPLQNIDSQTDSLISTKTKMDTNLALFTAFYAPSFKVCLWVH